MVQSMTGYGKAEADTGNGKLTVEIRTLNGKNADISIKSSLLPKDKELAIRKKIAERLQRGTIDVFLTYTQDSASSARKINLELAKEYYRQIAELSDELKVDGIREENPNVLISTLLHMPDVIDGTRSEVITDENWPAVEAAFDVALDNLCEFRRREGAVLRDDVTSKVNKILACSSLIEELEPRRIETIKERIHSRIDEIGAEPDPSRLEQEIIFYIEKLDINEERVRLRQHCRYYLETLENEEYPGKKLGFIAQEMGREINTTGSKANNAEIQQLVVRMKDELEKIKEQSLNIL